jgi:hypothetical protein
MLNRDRTRNGVAGIVTHTQLDLFDYAPTREALTATPVHRLVPADMSDADLIAALPDASFSEAPALAAEAGGRRLSGAVIALVSLCKRFHGFGIDRIVREQAAALLARVGRDRPDLADAVISALDEVDHPRAIAILSRLKRPPASFGRR